MPNFRKSMVAGGATDVRTFDQGALLKKNKTLKPQGVCSPVALIWIKHQSKNTSFADAIRTDAGLEEVLFIERLKKSEKDFCKAYLTDYNLHAHFEQKLYPPMYNGLKRILVAGPGYYFVGGNEAVWANESVGGHAFASTCSRMFSSTPIAAARSSPPARPPQRV